MKRFLVGLTFLALLAAPALADPVIMYREPLVWRSSLAAQPGAYQDLSYFTHATGAATTDTAKALSIRCIRPKPDLLAVGTATDSLLWMRIVLVPSAGAHAMAVAPVITIQTLQTAHTGAAAVTNGTATAMTQGVTAYTVADTSWSKAYTYGTVAANINGSTGSYVRVFVLSSMIGTFTGYVEYYTSCPVITSGGQP